MTLMDDLFDEDKHYLIYAFIKRPDCAHYTAEDFRPICTVRGDPKSTLREKAREWIIDEVGKNNYQETLDTNDEISLGYCLKNANTDGTRIDLLYVKEIETGWVRSVKDRSITLHGYFAAQEIPEYCCPYREKYYEALHNYNAEKIANSMLKRFATQYKDKLDAALDDAKDCRIAYETALDTIREKDARSYPDGLIDELKNFNINSLHRTTSLIDGHPLQEIDYSPIPASERESELVSMEDFSLSNDTELAQTRAYHNDILFGGYID